VPEWGLCAPHNVSARRLREAKDRVCASVSAVKTSVPGSPDLTRNVPAQWRQKSDLCAEQFAIFERAEFSRIESIVTY
jgi:hypothetical protein